MSRSDLHEFCAENEDAITELADLFSDYQPLGGMTQHRLMNWLRQFQAAHRSLALKLAQSIQYYSTHSIDAQLRALGKTVVRRIKQEAVPFSSVFYVPVGRAAESGQDIAWRYRNVNGMKHRERQFIHLLELPQHLFKHKRPMVVFLDDFIGTGKQVRDYWRDVVSQLVPEYLPLYLGVVAAYHDGLRKVEGECPIRVVSVHTLDSQHQLLGDANSRFNRDQKEILRKYCERWGNHPLGFHAMGALVSFFHGTPNNTPSVIRGSKRQRPYRGLLPGWDDL